MAYELLAITPGQFWSLCPAELRVMVKAARAREEKRMWQLAWAVAHLMNVSGKVVKRQVTPAGLLGKVQDSA